jgi:toxin CptA
MDEVVNKRRFQRLLSMGEASLWVVSGLLIANALGLLGTMPAGYAITLATIAGGVLLGIGAFVNRACVFGAIARLGSGEWAYVATPIGFYVGCLSLPYLYAAPAAQKLAYGSPVLQASLWVAVLGGAVMLVRLIAALRAADGEVEKSLVTRLREGIAKRIWSPHAATTVIGISFFFMLLLVGAWSYTDVLAELARGMSRNLVARTALLLAMLAGAVVGGFTAGRFKHTPITGGQLLRCFAGGVLMAWGSALIPGGNDGLILVGIPLLWPYAWLAFLTMCVAIGIAKMLERRLVAAGEPKVPDFGH